MLLKRLYGQPGPSRLGESVPESVTLTGLRLVHTGTHVEQNFSRQLIDTLVREGFCTLQRGKIILHTEEADLEYTILYTPGQYVCCHDGYVIADGTARGDAQRAYIEKWFPGVPSPDKSNPAGYRLVNGYECVLDVQQHEHWKSPSSATVSHYRGERSVLHQI
jgi:hypothetical protein